MSSYTEKIIIEEWFLSFTNFPDQRGGMVELWVELHNGLEYPVISSGCPYPITRSADPNFGDNTRVELSEEFLGVLGHVLAFMESDWRFMSMPASWVWEVPDKFPRTEQWVIGRIVDQHMRSEVPYEIEVLSGKAIEENAQCELHEFEESVEEPA